MKETSVGDTTSDLAWSSTVDMCLLIVKGNTFKTASKIALVVGTLLTVVNQGSVIIAAMPPWRHGYAPLRTT